jgi:hypothetical protein
MNVTFTVEDLAAATDAAVPYAMDEDTRLCSKLWPIRVTTAGGINTSIASFANCFTFISTKVSSRDNGYYHQLQTPRVYVEAPEFAEYGEPWLSCIVLHAQRSQGWHK